MVIYLINVSAALKKLKIIKVLYGNRLLYNSAGRKCESQDVKCLLLATIYLNEQDTRNANSSQILCLLQTFVRFLIKAGSCDENYNDPQTNRFFLFISVICIRF